MDPDVCRLQSPDHHLCKVCNLCTGDNFVCICKYRYSLTDAGCDLAREIQKLEALGELPGLNEDMGTISRLGFMVGTGE